MVPKRRTPPAKPEAAIGVKAWGGAISVTCEGGGIMKLLIESCLFGLDQDARVLRKISLYR